MKKGIMNRRRSSVKKQSIYIVKIRVCVWGKSNPHWKTGNGTSLQKCPAKTLNNAIPKLVEEMFKPIGWNINQQVLRRGLLARRGEVQEIEE
jgi:hypothetical protein